MVPADSEHSILPGAFRYDLERIDWHPRFTLGEGFIDLVFRRGDERRRLRFMDPSQVQIDQGFNGQCSGMVINDISRRGWEGVRIEVVNFEQDPGITFYASGVVDLDRQEGV
ncbi:MAG: hypothetical protein KAI24_22580 [Planctomycetes bacterium]|nr:hypothetical protein [Planctomycetota bacterium]